LVKAQAVQAGSSTALLLLKVEPAVLVGELTYLAAVIMVVVAAGDVLTAAFTLV
jgi:hypothetical protein